MFIYALQIATTTRETLLISYNHYIGLVEHIYLVQSLMYANSVILGNIILFQSFFLEKLKFQLYIEKICRGIMSDLSAEFYVSK